MDSNEGHSIPLSRGNPLATRDDCRHLVKTTASSAETQFLFLLRGARVFAQGVCNPHMYLMGWRQTALHIANPSQIVVVDGVTSYLRLRSLNQRSSHKTNQRFWLLRFRFLQACPEDAARGDTIERLVIVLLCSCCAVTKWSINVLGLPAYTRAKPVIFFSRGCCDVSGLLRILEPM